MVLHLIIIYVLEGDMHSKDCSMELIETADFSVLVIVI